MNLIECIGLARDKRRLRMDVLEELKTINPMRMTFHEFSRIDDVIIKGKIEMDNEKVGIAIQILDHENHVFLVSFCDVVLGEQYLQEDILGTKSLLTFIESIDHALTMRALGHYE